VIKYIYDIYCEYVLRILALQAKLLLILFIKKNCRYAPWEIHTKWICQCKDVPEICSTQDLRIQQAKLLLFDHFLIMYNLCVFTCIIFIFVFHCTHVQMSYVINSYLLTYLQVLV